MARQKSTVKSVDLTRTIRALKASGLTITSTKIEADGTVTLVHLPEMPNSAPISADDALLEWQKTRQSKH